MLPPSTPEVSHEMFYDDIHLVRVHPTRTEELALNVTCDNSTHFGLQRYQHCSDPQIRALLPQSEAYYATGAHIVCLMATVHVPNSVREEGLGYVPQEGFDEYPISHIKSSYEVAGV